MKLLCHNVLSLRGGHTEPLVLAITGSTGTGKSETASRIAQGLLQRSTRIGTSRDLWPQGLLLIRGEVSAQFELAVLSSLYAALTNACGQDYANEVQRNMSDVHFELKRRMGEHLLFCAGQGVVVFDEVGDENSPTFLGFCHVSCCISLIHTVL